MLTTLRHGTGSPAAVAFLTAGRDDRLCGTQDPERRFEVHIEDGVPLFVGHLLDHRVPGVAGVVDDDVQAAEVVDRGGDEAFAEVGVGDAADAGYGLPARGLDRGDCFLGWFGVEVIDNDPRTLAGQLQRDLTPDPSAGAGDNGDLPIKSSHG